MVEYKTVISQFRIISEPINLKRVKLSKSSEVREYTIKLFECNLDDINVVECVYVITVNNANNVTGFMKLSQGSITASIVDLRVLFKFVIDSLSSSFFLVHNHPSGKNYPSDSDIELTKKINEASKILGVNFLDHIIITEESYYSFADETSYL